MNQLNAILKAPSCMIPKKNWEENEKKNYILVCEV
jgi:hypothetical protein